MRRLLFPFLLFVFSWAQAQDYTNRGLLQIKELSEKARLDWNKSFDDGIQNKNLAALKTQRQMLELFLDQQLANMKQLMAQGDERALLTTIANYFQIEKQYVKNVMIPAESIKPTDAEAVARVNQQMIDFGQKEKYFLLEINNALATSGNDDIPPPPAQQTKGTQGEDEDEAVENAKNKSAVMGDEPEAKKHKKLPHEIMDEEDTEEPQPEKKTKSKHKGKQQKAEEEEE